MDHNLNQIIAYNLKQIRNKKGWSQSFVATQLGISIRTISRAENGCGISRKLLVRMSSLYQINAEELYKEESVSKLKEPKLDFISQESAVRLLFQNSFLSDLQREAILKFNEMIQKNAVMYRDEIEEILSGVISRKTSYSLMDVISCCMVINQQTVKNISKISVD